MGVPRALIDAEHSAQWVAWSLKHVASRAAWIGEMAERQSDAVPDDVLSRSSRRPRTRCKRRPRPHAQHCCTKRVAGLGLTP